MGQEREWSDGEKAILNQHWHSSMTCEEIGRLCADRSKNAVIAQAGRMKLGVKPRGRSRYASAPAPGCLLNFSLSEVVQPSMGVTLLDLEDGMCHWPLSTPTGSLFFCGCPSGGKYCDDHARMAFQPKRQAS